MKEDEEQLCPHHEFTLIKNKKIVPFFCIIVEGPSGIHASILMWVAPKPSIKPDWMVTLEFAGMVRLSPDCLFTDKYSAT